MSSSGQFFGKIKVVSATYCKIHFREQFYSGQKNGVGERIGFFHLCVLRVWLVEEICVFNLHLTSLRMLLQNLCSH